MDINFVTLAMWWSYEYRSDSDNLSQAHTL
jgi:hypothetical protein